MDSAKLRFLLERSGSYSAIEVAAASGELRDLLPVRLFEHIGLVYHRLERLADAHHSAIIAELRLAVLLHEESLDSLPSLLAASGFLDFAPTVLGVIAGFGKLWKATADDEIADYVAVQTTHLPALLLFELAHEGRPTAEMERAAELAGVSLSFKGWVARLPMVTPSNDTFDRTARSHSIAAAGQRERYTAHESMDG